MARLKLDFVQVIRSKRKTYYYFRREGYPRKELPGRLGSDEFMRAYAEALREEREEVGASGALPGSMKALAVAWRKSNQFKELKAPSQKSYTRLIDSFIEIHGNKMVKTAEPRHIRAILESMSRTPAQANALRNVLRQMFQFAFDHGWRTDNPVRDIKKLKYKKKPFPTWSEADIEAFEARWPLGTRARLALALLLYTGQRRSDVICMGPKSIHNGSIEVVQEKTEAHLFIPMHPQLLAAIEVGPCGEQAFLVTQTGKPFASGNAFYNWFKECAIKAGVQAKLGPHGLRKAAARRMAEAGCTPHQIASITGHQSLAEVERYTKGVRQRVVAEEAMQRLVGPRECFGNT